VDEVAGVWTIGNTSLTFGPAAQQAVWDILRLRNRSLPSTAAQGPDLGQQTKLDLMLRQKAPTPRIAKWWHPARPLSARRKQMALKKRQAWLRAIDPEHLFHKLFDLTLARPRASTTGA